MKSMLAHKQSMSHTDFMTFIQSQGPLFRSEADQAWVITDEALAKAVLTDARFSSDRRPHFQKRMPEGSMQHLTHFLTVASEMMVMHDGPSHTARRRVCYHAFGQKLIESMHPVIQQAIHEHLPSLVKVPPHDAVTQYAEPVSAHILASLFDVPSVQRSTFYAAADTMTRFFGGNEPGSLEALKQVDSAAQTLYTYFEGLLKDRKINDKGDFVSVLIQHQDQYELTDTAMIAQCIMILVAGQVTSCDQFTNNLYQCLTERIQWAELSFSEKMTLQDRLSSQMPAVSFVDRVALEKVSLGDSTIQPEDVVLIWLTGDRVFGFGPHYCLGSKLAKNIMVSMMDAVLDANYTVQINPELEVSYKKESLGFLGMKALPLIFKRREESSHVG